MRSLGISFESAEAVLAGEVILPDKMRPHPGVILLHAAAWGERRFYRVFAEHFARAGIASLIFDRRGEGASSGDPNLDIFTLAGDAVAAYDSLRDHPDIDAMRVGLWGYSNGAWVASLAASRVPSLAFLVLAGAAGVSPARAEIYRRSADLRSQGIEGPAIRAVERVWEIVFEFAISGVWDEAWGVEMESLGAIIASDARLAALPTPEFAVDKPLLDSVPRFGLPPPVEVKALLAGSSPDMGYDPIPSLAAVTCPVLIVLAEHDQNVPLEESLSRFEKVSRDRSGEGFRIEVIQETDHMFGVGRLSERTDPEILKHPRTAGEFVPGYLELMGGWMREKTLGAWP